MSNLEQLHELGIRLPIFILINNLIILLCLAECVEKLKQRRISLIASTGITSLAFTLMDAPYFLPSIFGVFKSSSENTWQSLFFATVTVFFSAILVAIIRLPAFLLVSTISPKNLGICVLQSLSLLLLLYLTEPILLVTAPLRYPIAFQLPVALKQNFVEDAQSVIDAGIPPERRAVFLLNPNMTHRIRQQVFFTSGAKGFVAVGKILGMEVRSSLQNQPTKLVNVVLSEVVLKSDRENQIEAFADAMAGETSETSDITVELFFGALLK